jgi:hypothetical protein
LLVPYFNEGIFQCYHLADNSSPEVENMEGRSSCKVAQASALSLTSQGLVVRIAGGAVPCWYWDGTENKRFGGKLLGPSSLEDTFLEHIDLRQTIREEFVGD